jgi:hypothetical protein
VYARASVLLLDDDLSAGMLMNHDVSLLFCLLQSIVDAHTAHHECLKGKLMQGRTVILVSLFSFVQQEQASCYITALDNSRVLFEGSKEDFYRSGILKMLFRSTDSSGECDYEEERELWRKTKKRLVWLKNVKWSHILKRVLLLLPHPQYV